MQAAGYQAVGILLIYYAAPLSVITDVVRGLYKFHYCSRVLQGGPRGSTCYSPLTGATLALFKSFTIK